MISEHKSGVEISKNNLKNVSYSQIIISTNEVFGDIMVLASPPRRPHPPVDPDDVNTLTRQIFNPSLSNFI